VSCVVDGSHPLRQQATETECQAASIAMCVFFLKINCNMLVDGSYPLRQQATRTVSGRRVGTGSISLLYNLSKKDYYVIIHFRNIYLALVCP